MVTSDKWNVCQRWYHHFCSFFKTTKSNCNNSESHTNAYVVNILYFMCQPDYKVWKNGKIIREIIIIDIKQHFCWLLYVLWRCVKLIIHKQTCLCFQLLFISRLIWVANHRHILPDILTCKHESKKVSLLKCDEICRHFSNYTWKALRNQLLKGKTWFKQTYNSL